MARSHVAGALLYLRLTSLRNLLLSRLRRLKQPKYLVGAVVGIAYIYFFFVRRLTAHHLPLPGGPLVGLPTSGAPLASILGAVALLVFILPCWLLHRARASLGFTEPEIAFLFPAPISRSTLIHFRMTSLALAAVFTALILALVSGVWPGVAPSVLMRLMGWWLVIATLSMHTIGSAFAITRWVDRGNSQLQSQLIALVVAAVLVGIPVAWLWHGLHTGALAGFASVQTGPVAWLLFPFQLLLGPLLAQDWPSFAYALVAPLVIYVAHYLWVLHIQVSFEEGSIAKAEKRAAKLAAMRSGNFRFGGSKQKARRAPFNIARAWRPELAFLWKNLLSTAEYLRVRNVLIAGAIIVVVCTWSAGSPLYESMRIPLGIVVMVFAGYLVLLGPQLARQDFRSDLPNTDLLKTYPLHGWQIMLGEMLTPAIILTGLLWLMLLAGAMLLPYIVPSRMYWLTPSIRTEATIGLALVAPLLCILQLLILNAAAVVFPAWVQTSGNRAQQGIEVMGQRIFFMAGQLLTLAVMLLPAVIVGAVVFAVSGLIVGVTVAAALAGLFALAVLVAEIGAGTLWLGQRFERLDLSKELRP